MTGTRGQLTIGELAEFGGVSTRTVRHYEELGILPPAPRSASGTRVYPAEWRFYLEGALALRQVGFALADIRVLARLALSVEVTPEESAQVAALVSTRLAELERRLRILSRLREVLLSASSDARKALDALIPPDHDVDVQR